MSDMHAVRTFLLLLAIVALPATGRADIIRVTSDPHVKCAGEYYFPNAPPGLTVDSVGGWVKAKISAGDVSTERIGRVTADTMGHWESEDLRFMNAFPFPLPKSLTATIECTAYLNAKVDTGDGQFDMKGKATGSGTYNACDIKWSTTTIVFDVPIDELGTYPWPGLISSDPCETDGGNQCVIDDQPCVYEDAGVAGDGGSGGIGGTSGTGGFGAGSGSGGTGGISDASSPTPSLAPMSTPNVDPTASGSDADGESARCTISACRDCGGWALALVAAGALVALRRRRAKRRWAAWPSRSTRCTSAL